MKRMKRFRPLALGAGASLTLGLVGCGNGPPGGSGSGGNTCTAGTLVSSGAAQVKVDANDNLQFSPASDNAKVGQIVQWTNSGTVAHTITFELVERVVSQRFADRARRKLGGEVHSAGLVHVQVHDPPGHERHPDRRVLNPADPPRALLTCPRRVPGGGLR